MNAPSIRSVAVAAAFLGLSMVVAGAATAMTAQSSDEPVATAVTIDHDDSSGTVLPSSSDEAPPATAVEVPAAPIECTPQGVCGSQEATASTVASSVEVAAPAPGHDAGPTTDGTTDAADCALPTRPDKPEDGDLGAWKQRMQTWFEDVRSAADECGIDRQQWVESWRQTWGERSTARHEPRDDLASRPDGHRDHARDPAKRHEWTGRPGSPGNHGDDGWHRSHGPSHPGR